MPRLRSRSSTRGGACRSDENLEKQRAGSGRMASADANIAPREAASWYPKAFPGVEKDLCSHLSTCACTHVAAARSEEPRHGSIELTAPHCGEIRKAMGTKTRSPGAG